MRTDGPENDGLQRQTRPWMCTSGRGAASKLAWTGWLAAALLVAALAATGHLSAQEPAGRYILPSGSMKPTILPGTVLPGYKYATGASPAPGDIVAFKLASDPKSPHCMRVVGLPGDRIQMVNGRLHINGEAVKREKMPDFADTEDGKTVAVKRWREMLPNGISYETLDLVDNFFLDNTGLFTVPADSLFVLGDNRDNAVDSRLPEVGFVPMKNVVAYLKLGADRAAH